MPDPEADRDAAPAHAPKAKPKTKAKAKKGKRPAAAPRAVVADAVVPDGQPLPGALARADGVASWPILLLRQGLLLVVDGIDARYGLGPRRAEATRLPMG